MMHFEMQIKALTSANVSTVAENWNYTEDAGSQYVMASIEYAITNDLAYGVFENSNLAACLIVHKYTQLVIDLL